MVRNKNVAYHCLYIAVELKMYSLLIFAGFLAIEIPN